MRNTPNYNLPQYEGTDKFTKEVLNDAFGKLDTAISDLQETFNITSTGGTLTTQEVINARNGKQNLKERIDEIDEQYKDIVTNDIPHIQVQMEDNVQEINKIKSSWKGGTPCFCIIDDDGKKEVKTILKPIFDQYGIKFSFCVITSRIGTSENYMNYEEIKQLIADGHTILSHTHNHVNLSTVNATDVENEMYQSKKTLKDNNIDVNYIAYPYGGINQDVVDLCRKYYKSGLTTETGVNLRPIMTQSMFRKSIGTFGDQNWDNIKSYIDSTIQKNGLGILTTHIADFTEGDIALLTQAIEYIKSKNVNIVSYEQAYIDNSNMLEHGVFDLSLKKHPFAIGSNGYVDGVSLNAIINLPINEITNGSSINHKSLKQNAINVNIVQNSLAGGLPKTSAGLLLTYMYENPFQEYKILYTNEWYIRRWNTSSNSWNAWESKEKNKIINTDNTIFQKTPSDFEKGVISYNEVNTANSVESPEPNRAGMLITNKICGGSREYWYQEYQPINRNDTYKRYATSDTGWSVWGKITFISQ